MRCRAVHAERRRTARSGASGARCGSAVLALVLVLALAALGLAGVGRGDGSAPGAAPAARWVSAGIAVELSAEPVRGVVGAGPPTSNIAGEARPDGPVREDDTVRFRFRITDTASHSAISGLSPAAWVNGRQAAVAAGAFGTAGAGAPSAGVERSCEGRVAGFLGGGVAGAAELDLNGTQVVVMNDDASLSVLDAHLSFGGSRLLAAVPLPAPAADWALAEEQGRLYVSLPAAGKVAAVDAETWRIAALLDAGPAPSRLALEPGGLRLWVLHDGAQRDAVTAIALSGTAAGRSAALPAGRGPHRLAFSADGRKAYVTNGAGGTVSVIEVATGRELRRLPAGRGPAAVAFSPLADAAYVASGADGLITVVDGSRDEVVATLAAEPGLGELRFAPGGRLGFLLNPEADLLHVIDAATRRIVQTGRMEKGPDQVVFSDTLAYIRHRGSETVLMVPLAKVGDEGQPIPVADFPGGRAPLGGGPRPSLADGLAKVPGLNAMLVANPADHAVYLYREGMAAPAGDLGDRGHSPRALLVVDRTLRERAPGVYETTARLRRTGALEVALFVDNPRLVHCFELQIEPRRRQEGGTPPVAAEARLDAMPDQRLAAGRPGVLRLRLSERGTGRPIGGRADVRVLVQAAAANWSFGGRARPVDGGRYEVTLAMPAPGLYFVYCECPSLGLRMQDSPRIAVAAAAAEEGSP
jgi:YVTN family beta-propeller protein